MQDYQKIRNNSLEINQFFFGENNVGGFINIFEDIFDGSGNLIGTKSVVADNLPPVFFDLSGSSTFGPQSLISVEKTILISGDDPGDMVSLDGFTQRFSQVPEPTTLTLLGIGLAGLGVVKRRRIRV
ncbi:protein of unknown function DUF1555 [Nitrosococcus halophilus Nc 4]|uniref:Ice-binding protein C-terminal domain-containing protein n=1 Tax=Nitrosococcus halophilus (strain Nc4) TaxID=472759 RepID=D5BXA8_NITHN|nr:PEP-CTERM sorting domain-containing protein [Nitrosococcus halophilus]ADE15791.1 protein of unknown function DUF1555 [Nitrosococcus halophilus Nc 4]